MKLNELIHEISCNINKINIIVGNVDIYCIGELILDKVKETTTYTEDPEYKHHYTNYKFISNRLIEHSESNKQNLLIATHSLEFIDAILSVAEDKNILDNISIFTIQKKENNNKDFIYRKLLGTKALQSRNDYNLDLRC